MGSCHDRHGLYIIFTMSLTSLYPYIQDGGSQLIGDIFYTRFPNTGTSCNSNKYFLVNYLDKEDEYKPEPEPEEQPKESSFNIIHIESTTKTTPLDDGGIWIG